MTAWQHGYGDGYLPPKVRKYPERPTNQEYMDGFMYGQQEWNNSRREVAR